MNAHSTINMRKIMSEDASSQDTLTDYDTTPESGSPSAKKPFKRNAREDLTERQKIFCLEYSATHNKEESYRKAYGRTGSCIKDAGGFLVLPKIKNEIARLMEPRLEKLNITAEKTLKAIADVAFMDPRKAFKSDGSMIPPNQLPDEIAAAILDIQVSEKDGEIIYKYKFNDRSKAHEQLAKHFGMFKPDQVEHQIKVSFVIEE